MRFFLLLLVMALGGCASLNLTDRDRQFQLARAESLFGARLDHCLNDPAVLFAIIRNSTGAASTGAADADAADEESDALAASQLPATKAANCNEVVAMLTPIVRAVDKEGSMNVTEVISIQNRYRRNEVIDALVAISNRKCGDYSAYLKTHDAQTNSSLSILALLNGGLGSVVGGEGAAQALSGTSAFFTGSRSALNETWFSNQTIHVLTAGFEKVRERQLREIRNKQACGLDNYGSMAGIGDALQYHRSCSLLAGLTEAAAAIDRADQPGMDTLRRQLADLQSIRAQAQGLGDFNSLGDSRQELELISVRNDASRRRDDATKIVNGLQDRLNDLRDEQTRGADIGERDISTEITSVQADITREQAVLATRNTELSAAQTALNSYMVARENRNNEQAQQRTQPGQLQGSQSELAVCPYTGQPARRSGGAADTPPQATQPAG